LRYQVLAIRCRERHCCPAVGSQKRATEGEPMHSSTRIAAATAALMVWLMLTPAVARDVIYVPTPEKVVSRMLELAEVGPGDMVIDLGSGDGRIAIAAVKDFGADRAIGIDIDPERIAESREN